jgi:hypothetical protein
VKIRRLLLLGGAVGVCLLLLTVQTRSHSSAAGDLLAYVTTPIQTVLAKGHRVAFGLWSSYLEWKNVRADNIRLRDEVQKLRVSSLRSPRCPARSSRASGAAGCARSRSIAAVVTAWPG